MYIAVATALLVLAAYAWWRRPKHPGISKPDKVAVATEPGIGWTEQFLGGTIFAEGRLVTQMQGQIHEIQRRNKNNSGDTQYRRGFHALCHAGLKNAEFRVMKELPESLSGVGFLNPDAVYNAIVRFSNAGGIVQPDGAKDLRGIAVRVEVPGLGVHDLLLTNGETSHARDSWQFMQFSSAAAGLNLWFLPPKLASIVNKILFVPNLCYRVGVKEAIRMLKVAIGDASRPVRSLATEQYWSRSPYAFGKVAAKFTLVPNQSVAYNVGNGDRFLREELIEQLKRGPVTFDLKLELWTDDEKTPLEDGSVPWHPDHVITVGQLYIPQQDLTTDEAEAAKESVEKLDFNPWYTLPDLCPLSSLNRARKKVYKASSGLRLGRDQIYFKPLYIRLIDSLLLAFFGAVNLVVNWHKLPKYMGSLNLLKFRLVLKDMNLHDTDDPHERLQPNPPTPASEVVHRSVDGRNNSLNWPKMGSVGTRIGRNVPLEFTFPDSANLLNPHPCMVSDMLFKRRGGKMIPARSLNTLAAWWIQMQIHGWFFHDTEVGNEWEIELPKGHRFGTGSMKIRRDLRSPQSAEEIRYGAPIAYPNKIVHWWGAGQIYGNDAQTLRRIRTHVGGRIKIGANGCLLQDPETKLPITGFIENWSLGLHVMHALFAKEHNAIAAKLQCAYPDWDDEHLFQKARLILSALMAKIHTIEWTPGILGHPALDVSMNANWDGLETAKLKAALGRLSQNEAISGIIGSPGDLAGVPFTLTEEFVSVYRMHPLVPDWVQLYGANNGLPMGAARNMRDLTFHGAQEVFADGSVSLQDVLYSWGISNPGAITLHNHPDLLRDITIPSWNGRPGQRLDLGVLDVFKDRARGVPRYNKFRELFHRGRVKCFEEVTEGDREVAAQLRAVYGRDSNGQDNVDMLDLMPGLYAEPLPAGFGFSDTAFRVFILMASRRLEADRFYTDDFSPAIYSQVGVDWINQNGFASVVLRHFPQLGASLRGVKNPFAPWNPIEAA